MARKTSCHRFCVLAAENRYFPYKAKIFLFTKARCGDILSFVVDEGGKQNALSLSCTCYDILRDAQRYEHGSTSLTSFIKQLSLIAVSVWGFIFWNSEITPIILIGIALTVLSLYLCFAHKKRDTSGGVSLKRPIYASLLLAGNAGSSITQKYQQMELFGDGGSRMMFFSTGFSALTCLALFLKGKAASYPPDRACRGGAGAGGAEPINPTRATIFYYIGG